MNLERKIIIKNEHSKSNIIEFYCNMAGFTPLIKSELKENMFCFFDVDFSIGDISNVDIEIDLDINKNIRVWCCHKNIQEYLNLLYLCYKFKGKNISVIFTDEYDEYMYSVGCSKSEEITNLLKYERKLTNYDIENYKKEWLKLVKINSEMRLFRNRKILNVDYDYLNDYIIEHRNINNINRWIGMLMGYDMDSRLSYNVYKFLVERLIEKGCI